MITQKSLISNLYFFTFLIIVLNDIFRSWHSVWLDSWLKHESIILFFVFFNFILKLLILIRKYGIHIANQYVGFYLFLPIEVLLAHFRFYLFQMTSFGCLTQFRIAVCVDPH